MLPRSPWKRRVAWACLLLVVAAVGIVAAFRLMRRPQWNVVLITLDTTRADHLGCYGDRKALTVAFDRLAERGILFEHAYAPIPLTLPSHASMLTGLYPPEHGLRTNGKSRLDKGIPTLAEILGGQGYDTGAFVASFVLDSKFGLDRGFQTYGDDLTGTAPADEALHRNRSGDRVMDEALGWLESRQQRPFLCWVHLYDPHTPYEDHRDAFGDRFSDRPYDAEIAFVDQQVSRLLEFLERQQLTERTIIVIAGDHGEGLGDHLERRHGQMVYNSTMHVPLIVSHPGHVPEGRRVAAPVSLIDVFPTILEAANARGAWPSSGRSLLRVAAGDAGEREAVYGETDEPLLESGWAPLRSLTGARWKYIRTARSELYDLTADPREMHDLAAEQRDAVERMEAALSALESGMAKRKGIDVRMSEEERQRLAALGYVGGANKPDADSVAKRPDVKDMIVHYNALEDAHNLLEMGQLDEALERLKALVVAAPDYELATLHLGDVYLRQKKPDEASAIYRGVLDRNPTSALARFHLGELSEAKGEFAEALSHYEEAVRWEPESSKVRYNLGRTLVILGRDPEAIGHFEAALELDPGFVFAHVELGSALARRGLLDAGLRQYETALRYDENSTFAHMNAAMVLSQQGRSDDALKHLEQAAKISPGDFMIRYQLGAFLEGLGRNDSAAVHLSEAVRLKPDYAPARELLETIQRRGPSRD